MEFRISNKGIKAIYNKVMETSNEDIISYFGYNDPNNLLLIDICQYLGDILDDALEDDFDTFVCLTYLSYSDKSDWIITENGIRDLTNHLNMIKEDSKYEDAIDLVSAEEEIHEGDVCNYILNRLSRAIEYILDFNDLSRYVSW